IEIVLQRMRMPGFSSDMRVDIALESSRDRLLQQPRTQIREDEEPRADTEDLGGKADEPVLHPPARFPDESGQAEPREHRDDETRVEKEFSGHAEGVKMRQLEKKNVERVAPSHRQEQSAQREECEEARHAVRTEISQREECEHQRHEARIEI